MYRFGRERKPLEKMSLIHFYVKLLIIPFVVVLEDLFTLSFIMERKQKGTGISKKRCHETGKQNF